MKLFWRVKTGSLLITCMLISFIGRTQLCDSLRMVDRIAYESTGGLVSYYFWEENASGHIDQHRFFKPYIQNFFILRAENSRGKKIVSQEELRRVVNQFAHDPRSSYREKNYTLRDSNHRNKVFFPLIKTAAEHYGSVCFVRKGNSWESFQRKNVLYFSIDTNGVMRYASTSDSVIIPDLNIRTAAYGGQYVVYSYQGENEPDHHRVFNYSGKEVTTQFEIKATTKPVRILVFANGYRGPRKENDDSDGLVTRKDRYHYWYKIDNRFIDVLKPEVFYYIDGSLSIHTTSHLNKFGFTRSFLRSRLMRKKERSRAHYQILNTQPNETGFELRKEKGRIAGLAFLYATCHSPECQTIKDTIDIVCHSMGYAYSLGFLDAIQDKVVLGKMYIIAAENACMEGYDWTRFQQVWQYGSNLGQDDADPVWEQDGVAPQCAVKGLELLAPGTGGRAFIPKDWPNKNFIDSHMVYSYDWIFDCIKQGETGFVCR